MKTNKVLIALLSSLFLLYGCIYESSVPIDEPSVEVDSKLLFTWENEANGDRYTLVKETDKTYSISAYNKENKTTSKMFAYSSLVEGNTYLNVWDEDRPGKKRKYNILKIVFNNDNSLHISPLTENISEQFAKSEDLKAFIAANQKDSFFFNQASKFIRTVPK